ncbi:hypothetical protein HK098_003577 [Nowakowskiella sp. JEL0407]|nr:hypothetical protein HK098_003577 [Nowakowskiella sp. JEL0407]
MVTNTNGCFFPITDVHTYHEVVTFKSGSVNGVVATSRTTTSHTTTHRTTTSPHTSSHSPSPSPHSPSPVSPLVSIKVVNSPVVTVVNSPVISISYIHSPESSQISSPLAKDENSSIGTLNVKENSTGNMTMIIGIAAAVLVLVIAIMAVIVIRQLRSKRPTSIIYTDNQLHEQRQPLFVNYSDMQYMSAPPQTNSQQHGVIMGTPQANSQQNFILGSTVNHQNVAAVEIPNAGFVVNAQSNQQTLYQENAYIPSPNQNAGMLTPIASQTRI